MNFIQLHSKCNEMAVCKFDVRWCNPEWRQGNALFFFICFVFFLNKIPSKQGIKPATTQGVTEYRSIWKDENIMKERELEE